MSHLLPVNMANAVENSEVGSIFGIRGRDFLKTSIYRLGLLLNSVGSTTDRESDDTDIA